MPATAPDSSSDLGHEVPSLTRARIIDAAENLVETAGVEGQIPVPLEIIADTLGYHLRSFGGNPEADRIAGAIDYDEKVIYLNVNDPLERRRFTLAHEYGHAVLHPGSGNRVDLRTNTEGRPGDRREIQANKFAAELLMPEEAFRGVYTRCSGVIVLIAKHFVVSSAAANNRASYLGLYR